MRSPRHVVGGQQQRPIQSASGSKGTITVGARSGKDGLRVHELVGLRREQYQDGYLLNVARKGESATQFWPHLRAF